ncbi:hypothetical protein PV416_47640 [Streptomyces ipomoeae]|nr:hypothetical protein [Streptomyces ipomoeae]
MTAARTVTAAKWGRRDGLSGLRLGGLGLRLPYGLGDAVSAVPYGLGDAVSAVPYGLGDVTP